MGKAGRCIGLILKYIVMYLSMLMPRSRHIWVFGAWLGERCGDNSRSLFIDADADPDIKAVWITRSPEVADEIRAEGRRAYLFNSPAAIHYQLRARYAVVTNGISDLNHMLLGGARFINLWHGVPLKKIGFDDEHGRPWSSRRERISYFAKKLPLGNEYLSITSEAFRDIYRSAFHAGKNHIFCLGQPRNDLFYEEEGGRHEQPSELALRMRRDRSEGRRVILYAPTHRKEGQEEDGLQQHFDWKALDGLCERLGAEFYIRKHFYHRKEEEDLSGCLHVHDVTSCSADTQTLLKYTDLLVTDYSSIYIDYLLLDRPVVFYDYDLEDYLAADRDMYVDYASATPGPKVRTYGELEAALADSLTRDGYAEARAKALDLFYAAECRQAVGQRLLDRIKEL